VPLPPTVRSLPAFEQALRVFRSLDQSAVATGALDAFSQEQVMLKLVPRRSWMLPLVMQAAMLPGTALFAAEQKEPAGNAAEQAASEADRATKEDGEAAADPKASAKAKAKKEADAGEHHGRRHIRIISPDGRTFELVGPDGVARLLQELTPEEARGERPGGSPTPRLKDGKLQTIRPDEARALIGDLAGRMANASQVPKFIIGVSVSEAPEVLFSQLGMSDVSAVVVDSVLDESPAAKAGVQKFDMILKANGASVASPADLTKAVKESDGKEIELVLMRSGKELTAKVTPRANDDAGPKATVSDGMIHFGPAFMDRRMMMGSPGEPMLGPGPLHEDLKALRKDVAELKKLVEDLKTAK
jgi:hypothetical protein